MNKVSKKANKNLKINTYHSNKFKQEVGYFIADTDREAAMEASAKTT